MITKKDTRTHKLDIVNLIASEPNIINLIDKSDVEFYNYCVSALIQHYPNYINKIKLNSKEDYIQTIIDCPKCIYYAKDLSKDDILNIISKEPNVILYLKIKDISEEMMWKAITTNHYIVSSFSECRMKLLTSDMFIYLSENFNYSMFYLFKHNKNRLPKEVFEIIYKKINSNHHYSTYLWDILANYRAPSYVLRDFFKKFPSDFITNRDVGYTKCKDPEFFYDFIDSSNIVKQRIVSGHGAVSIKKFMSHCPDEVKVYMKLKFGDLVS